MYLLKLILIVLIYVIRLFVYVRFLVVLDVWILEDVVLGSGLGGVGGNGVGMFLSSGVIFIGGLVFCLVFSCFAVVITTYSSYSLTLIIPFVKIISTL